MTQMKNYKASFFHIEKDIDPKTGVLLGTKQSYAGSIIIDDCNVDDKTMTLIGKAYRQGGDQYLNCNLVKLQEVKL